MTNKTFCSSQDDPSTTDTELAEHGSKFMESGDYATAKRFLDKAIVSQPILNSYSY